jgi:serine/threonine-protein kinase
MSAVEAKPRDRGFQAGDVIADKYELEAVVGEGGMGSVWRARHRQLESAVALKLMSPAIAAQPEALNRFLREARAAARLSSLHVVKVFDFGVDAATPFIAMELLVGESLRSRLDRAGPLSPEATLWVMRQTGRALTKAHGEGIVHRDLKPENLFITQQEDELLKVLDFGVAKLSGAGGAPSTSTRTGALLGTPFYMSPEQARGIKAVDHRSDIWSLGVIAFECLTGRLPFESQAFGDLVIQICTLPAPVPSSVARVPAGFDAWFARATAREPDQRHQSVDELVDTLQAAFAGAELVGVLQPAPAARRLPAAMANTELPAQHGVTGIDVTAAQSVMALSPPGGFGRRLRLLGALAALLGSSALLIFARAAPPPRAPAARIKSATVSSPAPAALPAARARSAEPDAATRQLDVEAPGAEAAADAAEPAADQQTAPAIHPIPDEAQPLAEESDTPAPDARNSAHPNATSRSRKPSAPARAAARAATRTADPATKPPHTDQFSDPD